MHRTPGVRPSRPFLVCIRSGAAPIAQPRWNLSTESRSFDLLANFFAPPAADCWLLEQADYVSSGGASKFSAAKQFLTPSLIDRYAGVFLLDDDVEMHVDPGTFGEFAVRQGFDLAQASVTPDSVAGHRVCLHHPSCAWRETNFVEVMAPYFSQALLRRVVGEFDRSISTWGLDVLWGTRYGTTHRMAVIDLYTMSHRRASDFATGAFYQYLRSIGVEPMRELAAIFAELGLTQFDIVTRRITFLQDGIRLPEDSS